MGTLPLKEFYAPANMREKLISSQPSYQQVNGMDASLGAGSMTPFSASSLFLDFPLGGQLMNYASGEAYDELARYQWQNSINDRFTYL